MKKNLFGWLAMATMLVGTGCSSDEVVNDYSPENAIQFGTYVGRGASGRAADITTANLGTQGFGVFAYYTTGAGFDATKHTPNFMYNQEVKNTSWNATNKQYSGPWVYAPVKYWPNNVNDKVSFFAYAPYCTTVNSNVTVDAATNTPGYPSVNFTLNSNDVTKQSDLLWAAPVLNLSKNSSDPIDTDDKVKFQFKHALSRIGFAVQTMIDQKNQDGDGNTDGTSDNGETLDNAYTKVVVKNVNLKGAFFNEGTLTWNNNNTAAITGSDSKETEFKLSTNNFAHSENIVWGSKENKYAVVGQSVNNVEAVLNNTNSYIMVIPQDFTNEILTIEVVYDVVTADNSLNLGYSAVTNTITTTFEGVKFEANKAYTFSLHLGLTTVKLTASVDAWGTGTDYSVNVPINTTGTDNTNDGVEDGSSN